MRKILGVLIGTLVGLAVGYYVVLHVQTLNRTAAPTNTPAPITDPMTQDYDTMRLATEYGCSATGLGDVIPGGAIVYGDSGPRHTTFDEGWAVYESGEGGVLLAVCKY